jgi:hypothetical protein
VSDQSHLGRQLVLGLIGAGAVAAGVVLATNKGFRKDVVDSAKALRDEVVGAGRWADGRPGREASGKTRKGPRATA